MIQRSCWHNSKASQRSKPLAIRLSRYSPRAAATICMERFAFSMSCGDGSNSILIQNRLDLVLSTLQNFCSLHPQSSGCIGLGPTGHCEVWVLDSLDRGHQLACLAQLDPMALVAVACGVCHLD